MSEEDFHTAGFQGSLPILTAKPPLHYWFVKHPYMALAVLALILLMIGFIKGLFGLARVRKIGDYGLEQYLYQPKKIKGYQQPDLKKVEVMYDDEGYPVHPDTKERVRAISEEMLFFLNCLFLFFWPCKKCCKRKPKAKKDAEEVETDEDATSDSEKSDIPKKKRGFFGRRPAKPSEDKPPEEGPPKEKRGFFGKRPAKPSDDESPKEGKESPPTEKKGFFGRRPAKPSEDKPPEEDKESPPTEKKGFFGRRPAKPSEDKPPEEDKQHKEEKPPKEKKGFFGKRPAKPSEDKPPEEGKPSKEEKPPKEEKSPKAGKGFFGRGRAKPPEDKPPKEDVSGKDEDKTKKPTEGMPSKDVSGKDKDKMDNKPSGDSPPKEDLSEKAQDEKEGKQKDENKDKQKDVKFEEQPLADETSIPDTKGPGLAPAGTRPVRPTFSDSDLDTRDVATGPVADPLNKELERWQKGTDRIKAVRK